MELLVLAFEFLKSMTLQSINYYWQRENIFEIFWVKGPNTKRIELDTIWMYQNECNKLNFQGVCLCICVYTHTCVCVYVHVCAHTENLQGNL